MSNALTLLRRQFSGLRPSSHKEMGLRCIRDALHLEGRNPERIEELTVKATFHLRYARAIAAQGDTAAR